MDISNLSGMTQVIVFAGAISIIVLILVELFKKTFGFDTGKKAKYLPLISIVLGLVVGAAVYPFTDMDLTLRLWAGFFAGAGSAGLYDLTKTIKK